MKMMPNFEKISHLYFQQKVDGFKEIIQQCFEEQHLLKDGKLCLNDEYSICKNDVCLVKAYDQTTMYMNYKDFCYVRDGYCFYFSIGYDWWNKKNTTNIDMKKDNRENGIYVYLNDELKDVLVAIL